MAVTLRQRIKKSIRLPLLIASFFGIFSSLAAHIEAICGIDPRSSFRDMWIFQLLLLVVLIPIIIEIFRKRSFMNIMHPHKSMRVLIYIVLAYYAVNFYWFLFWAAEHLDPAMTWRVVSAGWVLLFCIAAGFYDARTQTS
jgi:hypothetical protein